MLQNKDDLFTVAIEEPAATISFGGGPAVSISRALPAEAPINFVYANVPFSVMMATPDDLKDFAVGFSLTEGIIRHPADIRTIRIEKEERGIRVCIDLSSERLHSHLARKRALAGRTGCGICGIDDLSALPRARTPSGSAPQVAVSAIRKALNSLEQRQPLNEMTHAVHAAAWASLHGDLLFVREDVGRHNALDKLIGALLLSVTPPDQGFCIVTSRCSFELVEKIAAFGARTLIAISAPTSLALERARALDITLAAIARRDTMTVFHGLERVTFEGGLA